MIGNNWDRVPGWSISILQPSGTYQGFCILRSEIDSSKSEFGRREFRYRHGKLEGRSRNRHHWPLAEA